MMTHTKTEILRKIRHAPQTVNQLAEDLGVARNSVVVQVAALLADGLIKKTEARRSRQKGKPATYYEAVTGTEDFYSGAYKSFSKHLMAVLTETYSKNEMKLLIGKVGERIASEFKENKRSDREVTLDDACDFLDALGAETIKQQVSERDSIILSNSCPLASLVRENSVTCDSVAHFLRAACPSISDIKVQCTRENKLKCEFRVLQSITPATRK